MLENRCDNVEKLRVEVDKKAQEWARRSSATVYSRQDYDPAARCTLWTKTLDQIIGNEEWQLQLQQFFGYCLLPTCRLEKALVLYGSGTNGKTTIMKVLKKLMGREKVSHLDLNELGNALTPIPLRDSLVNLTRLSYPLVPSTCNRLKWLISGEPVHIEEKYGEGETVWPTTKFVFEANSMPPAGAIHDDTFAFTRRFFILKLQNVFSGPDNCDVNLVPKLLEELPGIYNWALEGAHDLLFQGSFVKEIGSEGAARDFFLNSVTY